LNKIRFSISALLALFALFSITSCTNLGYYAQATRGQLQILNERKSIDSLLASEETDPALKAQLEKVVDIRDFATRELLLPENGSYRSYADIGRPHVVWNVVATPEFALEPIQWCFPIAGCVSYRGFFTPKAAENFAEGLRAQGHDVYLYGVGAYSTLGWFDDPVLNTFVHRSEPDLAALIFHELAHQKLYIKNDSAFNESFARAVEEEGVIRYLSGKGGEEAVRGYLESRARQEQWVQLVFVAQQSLRELFASDVDKEAKRIGKDAIYADMLKDYKRLKELWGGFSGYDRWFTIGLNNAKIASVDTYNYHIPAFQRLLQNHGGNLALFFEEAKSLGELPRQERLARLEVLRDEYIASLEGAPPEEPVQTASEEIVVEEG
jgi:predicted aminopeptidase